MAAQEGFFRDKLLKATHSCLSQNIVTYRKLVKIDQTKAWIKRVGVVDGT